jgi:hypothetical protein
MDTNQQQRPLLPARRFLVRSFAWGAGCGFALAVVLDVGLLYEQRPKPWDTRALRAKHSKAEGLSRLNESLDEVSSGITFSVDVENTTALDITLPRTLATMGQTRASHALHGVFLKLDGDYFLPAGHVTTISLDSDDLCAANCPSQQCFDRYFKDDEDLVIFDESHRYEVLIPVPTLTLPSGPTVSPETPAPPCKNGTESCEPWERAWSKTDHLKPGDVVTKQGTIVHPQ